MREPDYLAALPFDDPQPPISLYAYAPVYRVRDRRGDWVVKRTGLIHSDGPAIGAWLQALAGSQIDVVAPAEEFAPNPRTLGDGKTWVVYPYVEGTRYTAAAQQIAAAGTLLGRIHAAPQCAAVRLKTYAAPPARAANWIHEHAARASKLIRQQNMSAIAFEANVAARSANLPSIDGLPLAGCSFDFKASNLVFSPKPVLVDPDHAANIPRLYDLAITALLFHNDLPTGPGRLWTAAEWRIFLSAYQQHVEINGREQTSWPDVLRLAWLDQGVWLLGNFPEGWADPKEAAFLFDLATLDLGRFELGPKPAATASPQLR